MVKGTSTPERKMVDETSPSSNSPVCGRLACCLPLFRKHKKRSGKSVKFLLSESASPLRPSGKSASRRSKRSPSKKSFYSAVSVISRLGSDSEPGSPAGVSSRASTEDGCVCPCGFSAHSSLFDPLMPLMVPPNVEAGSFAELEIQARAICGRWLTVVERSDSLDPQMVYVGIGKMKRMVMNRLVIPLGAELVDGGETLKVWIETPVGNKITHASLVGKETFDADGDLGDWTAKSYVTDYAWIKFCNGKEFRALQMQRENPKLGTAFETKAVLPDNEFGKILLYNITIQPPAGSSQSTISVDRVYKYEGPIA